MLLPSFHQDPDNRTQLSELAIRIKSDGGSVIVYTRVLSFILITVTRTIYEHVPTGKSPYVSGLKHSLVTLLFGWCSFTGPFLSLQAIVANSMGGLDVTHFVQEQNHVTSMSIDSPDERLRLKERRVQIVFGVVLFSILGIIYWKLVLPIFDSSLW